MLDVFDRELSYKSIRNQAYYWHRMKFKKYRQDITFFSFPGQDHGTKMFLEPQNYVKNLKILDEFIIQLKLLLDKFAFLAN
jgi:hypothetical protein